MLGKKFRYGFRYILTTNNTIIDIVNVNVVYNELLDEYGYYSNDKKVFNVIGIKDQAHTKGDLRDGAL